MAFCLTSHDIENQDDFLVLLSFIDNFNCKCIYQMKQRKRNLNFVNKYENESPFSKVRKSKRSTVGKNCADFLKFIMKPRDGVHGHLALFLLAGLKLAFNRYVSQLRASASLPDTFSS